MQTILRSKFPDTPLDAELLENVAGLWSEWHVRSLTTHILPRQNFHRAQARLWGVARPDIEACRLRLSRRATQALPDSSVERSDPDTLTVTSPWRELAQPTALARLAGLFGDEEFKGMRLTLRLTTGAWRGTPDGRALNEGTLVLWTELRGGVLRLKGIWPGDLSGRGEAPFHFASWKHEVGFWQAVDRFREMGEAPPSPERLFISPARQLFRRAARWLQFDVGEQRTLATFLTRLAVFGGIAAICLAAVFFSGSLRVAFVAAPPGLLALDWFLVTIFKKLKNAANYRRNMRARLREMYTQPLRYLTANLAEASPWPEASTAKYTREAAHLGCLQWRDIRRDNSGDKIGGGVSFVRVFALPAQRTYLFLSLMHSTRSHKQFPAKAWFMSATYFTDGSRLLLTNEHGGYSRSRDSAVVQRFFPEAEDLAELLELRRPVVQRLISGGKEPAPLMSIDELVARMEADHERIAEAARKSGYFTWGAALRQSLHLIRPEYRSRS